jgi:hypothetical protein
MKKSKYLVEYKIGDKYYNYILKSSSKEEALIKFEKLWIKEFGMVYPYKHYEIISIIQIINKLKNY